MSNLVTYLLGLAVTFFVPAVVWTTVAAGLYQLAREEIRQIYLTPRRAQRLERYSQRAG